MDNIFCVNIGDDFSKNVKVYIKTNYESDDIDKAWDKSYSVSRNSMLDYCLYKDYISSDDLESLLGPLGYGLDEYVIEEDKFIFMNTDLWFDLWVKIIKYSLPDFEYEIWNPEDTFYIGGYGIIR